MTVFERDSFGLGAAARSPAAKSIAQAVSKLLYGISKPLQTFLGGHAETSVQARRIIKLAEAEAKAALIRSDLETDLRQRAANRVLAEELCAQLNLEAVTEEAILIAAEDHTEAATEIPQDWMESWGEGARAASAEQVRTMYASILARKATGSTLGISGTSVRLLRELDAELADRLKYFVSFITYFGSYPFHDKVNAAAISDRDIRLLIETGFLSESSSKCISFHEFAIRFGGPRPGFSSFLHQTVGLTQRGADIANAVWAGRSYEENFGPKPPDEFVCSIYLRIIGAALEVGPRPLALSFSGGSREIIRTHPTKTAGAV